MSRIAITLTVLAVVVSGLLSGCSTSDPMIKRDPLGVAYPTATDSSMARLTIAFDDGYTDNYTEAFPRMLALGVPGVIALTTGKIGSAPGYLTEAQCQTLWDNGWDLVSHTVTHPLLNQLSLTDLDRELRESQAWVADHGWNGDVLVSPFGGYNPDVLAKAKEYYRYHRALTGTLDTWPPQDNWHLGAVEVYGGDRRTTPVEIKQWIDYAYQNGLWLTLLFHHIDNNSASRYSYLPADFQEVIEYAAGHPIPKVTYRDLFGVSGGVRP